jgi:hypothetical protein
MNSRLRFLAVAAWCLSLAVPTTSSALEKKSVRAPDDGNEWRGGSTACTVSYYNICTGWLWVWSGFVPEERIGVNFESCCSPPLGEAALESTELFWATGAPAGYGFTGTIDLWAADANGCPVGPSLASQPHLPTELTVWATADFSSAPVSLPSSFVLTYTFGTGLSNPAAIGSDHPAAGPTGPAACGTCYPNGRTNHSFDYGTPASPTCPGSVFNDGVCNAELMIEANLSCTTSVDESSWGQIKGLYR